MNILSRPENDKSDPITVEWFALRLNAEWALDHDELQWLVMRWWGPARGWRPAAFVATKTIVLKRVLNELSIEPTPEANAVLDHIPETFQEWIARPINFGGPM